MPAARREDWGYCRASVETAAASGAEPRVLAGIGYLLLIVAFFTIFVPEWVVCGLGLNGSHVARRLGGRALGVTLAFLGVAIGTVSGCMSARAPAEDGPQPFLVVKVQSVERGDEELIVRGSVRNTGEGPAYSPAVELSVFEDPGETLLADEIAYPEGTYLENLDPGRQATFELVADLPVEAGRIRWAVTIGDFLGQVITQE